jgi:hypothetical protein
VGFALGLNQTTPMSWRRGLTRLWIVASFLWGTICVALFWPTSKAETYAAYWRLRLLQPSLFRDAGVNRDQIDKISDAHRTLEGDDCRDYTPTSLDNLRFDQLNSPDPDQRCGVDIQLDGKRLPPGFDDRGRTV